MLFKRKIFVVLSLLFCAVIALVTANSNALSPVSAKHYAKPQIILDAGHPALKNTKNTIDFKIYKASPKKMHKKNYQENTK